MQEHVEGWRGTRAFISIISASPVILFFLNRGNRCAVAVTRLRLQQDETMCVSKRAGSRRRSADLTIPDLPYVSLGAARFTAVEL